MNQRAGSSQIFGQALPCRARGQAEDPAASMQAASHKLEDCFLTKCCCWAGCCWGGNLAQIQNGRLQSDFLAKRGCEPLRTLSCASVCACGRRVLTGCSLQAEVRGLGEEMAPLSHPICLLFLEALRAAGMVLSTIPGEACWETVTVKPEAGQLSSLLRLYYMMAPTRGLICYLWSFKDTF